MTKVVITQKQIDDDPNVFWNAFIDVVGGSDDADFTPLQRHCHLCFRYYNEIMNGGHLQFFENYGMTYADDVLRSLNGLGLTAFAPILVRAIDIATKQNYVIRTVEEYVEVASRRLFDHEDEAFYSLSPDLLELLQDIGIRQKDEFFTIVP